MASAPSPVITGSRDRPGGKPDTLMLELEPRGNLHGLVGTYTERSHSFKFSPSVYRIRPEGKIITFEASEGLVTVMEIGSSAVPTPSAMVARSVKE
jgi:hypothetical protein